MMEASVALNCYVLECAENNAMHLVMRAALFVVMLLSSGRYKTLPT
jgi:hypothetical protein